jgi:hypothetical protein
MDKETISCTLSGFRVRKFNSTEGKKEEQLGSLNLALIADKEDVKVNDCGGQLNVSDVLAALGIHQSSRDEVTITLSFSVPKELATKIKDMRKPRS